MSLPPGPPLPMPVQTLLWVRRPTELMSACRRRYGKTFTLRLPAFTVVLTSDAESVRAIFAARPEELHAGRFNAILRPLVGSSSVLLLDGPDHIARRKLLLPSFQGDRMRFYGRTMAEITSKVIADWPADTPFSLHRYTQEITFEVILRTVFGLDEGAQLTSLREQMRRLLAGAGRPRVFVPLLFLSQRPELDGRVPFRFLLRHRARTDELLYRQIAARRTEPGSGARTDVLAMLLAARDEDGRGLTDRELRDELMTALAAGHETTATALAWAVERILLHPEAYAKLCDEVRGLGPRPDPERLAQLPYLDATIKEVLRLRPVIPIVGRYLQRPFTIDGYELPAGTAVAPCVFLLQREAEYYAEPEAFRPERFLGKAPDPATWLPFGGGFRRCIGLGFAMYEMKIVLGTILAECDLELVRPVPSRVVRRAVTFWPEGGTRVRARPLGA